MRGAEIQAGGYHDEWVRGRSLDERTQAEKDQDALKTRQNFEEFVATAEGSEAWVNMCRRNAAINERELDRGGQIKPNKNFDVVDGNGDRYSREEEILTAAIHVDYWRSELGKAQVNLDKVRTSASQPTTSSTA